MCQLKPNQTSETVSYKVIDLIYLCLFSVISDRSHLCHICRASGYNVKPSSSLHSLAGQPAMLSPTLTSL